MARVLGRVRLSKWTDTSTSVVRQKKLITEWSKARGHELVGWAIDENFSRSVRPFDAPEFGPWLTDPELIDRWDMTVAWRLDRFGAGWRLGPLFTWCLENGKNLNTTTVDIDLHTTTGRIVATVLSEMSQGELEAIQERTQGSQRHLRSIGRWHGGRAPYWLKPKKKGPGWTLALDPEPSAVTERIIEEFLPPEPRPVDAIAKDLTAEGIASPQDYYRVRSKREHEKAGIEYRGKEPTGQRWFFASVMDLLTNPSLLGWSTNGGTVVRDEEGNPVEAAEALVTPQRWEEIQSEISRRAGLQSPHREHGTGPLYGVLKCAECGKSLHHARQGVNKKTGREYIYYRSVCKHNRLAPRDIVEDMVLTSMNHLLGNVNQVERLYIPGSDNSAELEQAERAYEDISARLPSAPSERVFESLTRQLDGLTVRIQELSTEARTPSRIEYRTTGKTFGEVMEGMTVDQVRDLMLSAGITVDLSYDWQGLTTGIVIPEDLHEHLGLSDDVMMGAGGDWPAGFPGSYIAFLPAEELPGNKRAKIKVSPAQIRLLKLVIENPDRVHPKSKAPTIDVLKRLGLIKARYVKRGDFWRCSATDAGRKLISEREG
ncbi:hypothetical protein DMP23_05015 [Amycolatopsis sp. A1MSW2902]|uniref:recombinase family protein n=1 Tax=Amycolatopsis sp. A1MSW2902 TaxID=687413 RepID=UPI00307D94F9